MSRAGDALSAARSDSYDLMILDLMMPGMSGLELPAARAESKIPIVMLTAQDAELDRVSASKSERTTT